MDSVGTRKLSTVSRPESRLLTPWATRNRVFRSGNRPPLMLSGPTWTAFGRADGRAFQPGRHALVPEPRRQPEATRHDRAERQREAQPDIFAQGPHQHRAD